ncbi:hypothetical protein Taro_048161 [Colocasia esculenta]|uniref:Reverse transcriptase zinc-binding domain-containing protein n=1 Tax=Colocasia esculenta TaxID=4460 RepID=A0A843X4V5_COLES|nr:hypothetical protein [Colocasia esculenta]
MAPKCVGVFLFSNGPNGPPLEEKEQTVAGADKSLQNQDGRQGNPVEEPRAPSDAKIFVKAKEVVLANIRWLGGDGSSVNFFKDTWIGPSPLMHVLQDNSFVQESRNIMVNEMVHDTNNPVWTVLNVSPRYVHSLLTTSQDDFIWAANPHGNFTVKSAYDLSFSHGVSRGAWEKLWHHAIPPRVAMFAWRLLHRDVPVDSRIVECGVPLVSMCSCCKVHAQESLDHLFISSDIAKELWSWIAPLLSNHINWSSHVTTRFWSVLSSTRINSPLLFAGMATCILMLWEV